MTTPTCGVCRFFAIENALARMGTLALYAETSGECRRFPPHLPRPVDSAAPRRPLLPTTLWPILPASAWCGEFAPTAPADAAS